MLTRDLSFFHACRCSRDTCHSSILTGVRAGHVILPCVQMFARYTPLFHACRCLHDTCHSSMIAGVRAIHATLPCLQVLARYMQLFHDCRCLRDTSHSSMLAGVRAIIIILVLPPGVVGSSNGALPMLGTADGDAVSRCHVLEESRQCQSWGRPYVLRGLPDATVTRFLFVGKSQL